MKDILLIGPVFSNSGYGVHSRQVFEALLQREEINLYVAPSDWGNSSWRLDLDLIKEITECCNKKVPSTYDEVYQVCLPNEWRKIGRLNIGVTAGFESNFVRKNWSDAALKMDKVIVPSEFTRLAFANTLEKTNGNIPKNIEVINEWYLDDLEDTGDNSEIKKLNGLKYDNNILIFGQMSSSDDSLDRKNTIKTLRACLEFCDGKEIGILFKTNIGNNSVKSFYKLREVLEEKFSREELDKIALLSKDMTDFEVACLYKSPKVSCIVSGTRGEGWGLPLINAAAAGVPVIATNYSSYKEYLEEDFLKVDYDLVQINEKYAFVDEKDFVWAEFDYDDMIQKLEVFFENEEVYRKLSFEKKKIIKQKFCKNNIIKHYNSFFEKLK